jgi:hypothetical protein
LLGFKSDLAEMFLGLPSTKFLQRIFIPFKHGRQVHLYVYIRNFENLVKNYLLDFKFDLAELFFRWLFTKFLQRILRDLLKNIASRGVGHFPKPVEHRHLCASSLANWFQICHVS